VSGALLEILQSEHQLVETGAALRRSAEVLTAQLGDLQLEPFDLQLQGITGGVGLRGFKPGDFQRSARDLQITRAGFGR
jgi:hypothetical protein